MEATASSPKKLETPPTPGAAPLTGIYASDRVPGTYLKTMTGVQRGEELFHRPDFERPWRTTAAQRHAVAMALKEKEIEELMRKCSSLRTQLGNARHDAKYMEFAASEKAKMHVSEMQREVARLESELKKEKEEKEELKTSTEHQLRLMRAQHEKDLMNYQNEKRLLDERCAELTKSYQQQIEDVKKAAARELEYVETLCNGRVEQLTSELRTVRAQSTATEERHAQDLAESKCSFSRVEADYKERVRVAEQCVGEVCERLEAEKKKLTEECSAALKEATLATERMTIALTDREEVLNHFKQWNAYILCLLDGVYTKFLESAPALVPEPSNSESLGTSFLYTSQLFLDDPTAKVTAERIAYRLLQLQQVKSAGVGGDGRNILTGVTPVEVLDDLAMKQRRLTRAFEEIEAMCAGTDQSLGGVLSRLCFFNDDLNDAIAHSGTVEPPQKSVIFVCLSVFRGTHLWTEDAETARAAVSLMNSALRPKMTQYGAYECYSDGTSMLLAFGDPVSACRFCVESQAWLMTLPWSPSLLRGAWGQEERGEDNTVLFRGLRLCMAIHTGDTFVEPTAIPHGNSYRCHYYGRAVSQVMYLCSLAQGGQVLLTGPVWDICAPRVHELGAIHVRDLGAFPIVSFDKEKNTYERESLSLRQILPHQLASRSFQEIKVEDEGGVVGATVLAKMRRSALLDEINCVESRRANLNDAIRAVNEELMAVDHSINALKHKTREVKSHFHLLPPPEMVRQMNELYSVMEKIALRASDLRDELRGMGHMQEELAIQTRGLKDYCHQHAFLTTRTEELRTHLDMMHIHHGEQIDEMRRSHSEKVEQLQRDLREREQMVQRLYRELQSVLDRQ